MENEIGHVLAVVALAGFAIQQVLQILDPVIMAAIAGYKTRRGSRGLPGGMSDAEFKKTVMAFLGFSAGMFTVSITRIGTLALLRDSWTGYGDMVVTALVVSGGTEGFNTLLKYVGYVKDARKQALDVLVTVTPSAVTVVRGGTVRFTARVEHGSSVVTWRLVHGTGGTIDQNGLYTAPAATGTYQVLCESVSDPTRPGLVTITVT